MVLVWSTYQGNVPGSVIRFLYQFTIDTPLNKAGDKSFIGYPHFHCFLLSALIIMVVKIDSDPFVFLEDVSCNHFDRAYFLLGWCRKLSLSTFISI